ncbi:MAG: TonB-dependent receptor [Halothiobacillaceae bacterium]|nr:TonB-dependent receptor [Halothiobacillaceae bacterium]
MNEQIPAQMDAGDLTAAARSVPEKSGAAMGRFMLKSAATYAGADATDSPFQKVSRAHGRMIIRTLSYTVVLLAATWIGSAAAQSPEEDEFALIYGDKATISIATGSKQPLRRAPSVATVITAEEIAAMGAMDLDAVLETVPGIHVTRASIRYATTYEIRGAYGGGQSNPQVLLLQNGIPATTDYASDKGYAWIGVPVENIARIEIIRGPGSALYGADAYAGVINIITKTAADTNGTEFGVRAGSFNSKQVWGQHGGRWGAVDVATYLNIGRTDGIREIIPSDNATRFGTSHAPGPVSTGHDAVDASLDLALDKWRLRTAYKLRDKMGTGVGISSALDPTSFGRSEDLSSDLSWNDPQFARDWSANATAALHFYSATQPNNLLLYPAGTTFGTNSFPNGMIGGPNYWDRQFRLSGNATYTGFIDHSLRLGIGYDHLDLYKTVTIKNYLLSTTGAPTMDLAFNGGNAVDYSSRQPFITPHHRDVRYLYAQDEWYFARDWTLTAGVRHDRYTDFGSTTNPRLALVWDTSLNLTSKLLYGRAFRAPSFNEQYGINPVANGNPALNPETIQTLEAAFSWQARRDTQVNLNLFRYDMQDLIRLVANTAPALGSTNQNIGTQSGKGFELETAWDASHALRITGNYAWQHAIDDATGRDAGYAPHRQLYLRTDWRFANGWAASAQLNRVMDRMRPAGDSRAQIPDYTTVDLSLRSRLGNDTFDCSLSVLNLFDAKVLEPSLAPGTAIPNDLPMAPRSIWLQLNYRL